MSLIDTYFSYQVKYANQYGPNTIVFMEVGSFFEIYGADSKEGGKIIHRISNLLNLHVSRKNGKHKKDSPYMAGFPNYALEKYVKVLLQNSFTIVIIEQRMVDGSKKPERSVTRILSPGTDLEHAPTFHSNHLVSLYVDIVQPLHRSKKVLYCGMAFIDVTTGLSKYSEFHVPYSKVAFAMSHISEKLHSIHPSEIIWTSPHSSKDSIIKTHATDYAMIERLLKTQPCLVHRVSSLENMPIQEHLFNSVYPHRGTLSVTGFLGLSRHTHARNAFAQLLKFVETHHAIALQKLPKPTFESYDDQCILASSTLDQLQIISKNKSRTRPSLLHIVNKCSTPMGKRCLFDRLTHPIFDIDILHERYQGVQDMLKPLQDVEGSNSPTSIPTWKHVEAYLECIVDVERLHRRMELAKLRPAECASFYVSYREIRNVLNTLTSYDICVSSTPNTEVMDQFIQDLESTFEVDKMACYTLDTVDESFFVPGKYSHIDDLQSTLEEKRAVMESWRRQYNDLIDPTKTTVRLITTDKEGTYMSLTKNRYLALKTAIEKDTQDNPSYLPLESLRVTHSKSDVKLKGGMIRSTSDEIIRCVSALRLAVCEQYQACMKAYCATYKELFHSSVTFISEVDVFKSGAKCATMYGYCCPQLYKDQTKSMVEFKDIRHPIIERIQEDTPYITNDVSFNSEEQQGILLYGVNAAGKSSLMKAVGVNIILAQAGFFVAASHMNLTPYRNIFTRLTKEDNMYEGLSSFAVEMTELRSILLRADRHSIVLGDELCSGTESVSALAIVSAGIIQLYNRGTTFFFATHLHKLSNVPRLSSLGKLKKHHLSVTYEPSTGALRYDRKLSLGVGSSLYGLEVCKGMDMPSDFMDIAAEIREDMDDTVAGRIPSQYNSEVIRHDCGVCGDIAEDTHHIQFQASANETTGMIGHIHKNRKSNLVCLCKHCHYAVHHGQLSIHGYAQTTKGRILHYEWTNKQQQEKKKFKTNHIQWIMERCDSKMPVHVLKSLFEKEFNLSISNSSVSKIRNGTY